MEENMNEDTGKQQEVIATSYPYEIPEKTEKLRSAGWVITRVETYGSTYLVYLDRWTRS